MSDNAHAGRPRLKVIHHGNAAVLSSSRRTFMREESTMLQETVEMLKRKNIFKFVLDFSRCTYISSEGLGATAQLWNWCQGKESAGLAVVLPPDTDSEVHKLFEIVGLLGTIGSAVQPTVEDAVKYLDAFS